ncbi:hypothetical protein BJV74DRAFT_793920 [Russula compacta]|nr:hypothetical protein BJV74DRAFT_793920 [Russula compacta]
MSTSGQFLTVPPLNHRSSQHRRRESAAAAVQSPRTHHSATGNAFPSQPPQQRAEAPISPDRLPPHVLSPPSLPDASSTTTHAAVAITPRNNNDAITVTVIKHHSLDKPEPGHDRCPIATTLPAQHLPCDALSPATAFSAVGPLEPDVHFRKSQINKAPQSMTYTKTLVCADAVNAEVLLRLARNELLERAQRANRHVTALVDEEWRYSIRQTKSGDYNVEVFYSAYPAQCESQNSDVLVDPRKPVALSHVTNIPGLMRVVHSE